MSTSDKIPTAKLVPQRVGGWLPVDNRILEKWLAERIAKVETRWRRRTFESLHPVIQEFQALIEGDAVIFMGFHQMFEQVPTKPPYNNDPTGKPQVRDYKLMLFLFDLILKSAPDYEDNALVGFPINAILDWPMGTPAGYAMFTNDKVNAMFKKMFDVWASFLVSTESTYVLTDASNGWFGPAASEAIPNFTQTFQCEPGEPHMGFTSWDHFFTRLFREGVRPIEGPGNEFITSACESTVYNKQSNVKERDTFWLKSQPYSLADMLNHDEYLPQFIGGTIYQAFLSATNYHRWHSPINGKIVKVVNIPGTYYAESPVMGLDPAAPDMSQSFITAMAARALIFIQSDYEPIGLMCLVAVGMSEVSTCQVTVRPGLSVIKGDELGMFHFGGSTHCLIFRPETNIVIHPNVGDAVLLNSVIAAVQPSNA